MDREKLLTRIKKLLELGSDKNPEANEAATALRKAQQLMAEYNIEMVEVEDIDLDGEDPWEFTEIELDDLRKIGVWMFPWKRSIQWAVGRATNTRGLVRKVGRKSWPIFCGDRLDCEVAAAAYSILFTQAKRGMKLASSMGYNKAAYCNGFAAAVCDRVQDMLEPEEVSNHECYALVVQKKETWLDEQLSKMKLGKGKWRGPKDHEDSSFNQGYKEGRNADLGFQKKVRSE